MIYQSENLAIEGRHPPMAAPIRSSSSCWRRTTESRTRSDVKMTIHLEDYSGDIRLSDFVFI